MSRRPWSVLLCSFLLLGASCSKREKPAAESGEWTDVQAMADDAVVVPAQTPGAAVDTGTGEAVAMDEEFNEFCRKLAVAKSMQRKEGETLLTGDTVVFDYGARFVRMDGRVEVLDDNGRLETDSLTGRFSVSNQVDYIEAKGGVRVVSETREAESREAVYNYLKGTIELYGNATVGEGANRLSGERIVFQIKGDRTMLCEPNALLLIAGGAGSGIEGLPADAGDTEIRADKMVYDEVRRRVDLTGKVRLRNGLVAMNCSAVRLFLKEGNEIDWIEAVGDVIIQTQERKALADRAVYQADEGKFTLEGHPMVLQGRHVMTGDRILFWQETRGLVCEPNARVLLYLDEATRSKLLRDLNN